MQLHSSRRPVATATTLPLVCGAVAVAVAVPLPTDMSRLPSAPLADALGLFSGAGGLTPLLVFFAYVWALWCSKVVLAARCRPFDDVGGRTNGLRTSIIVPVYDEPLPHFRRVLESLGAHEHDELIVVVDGAAPELVALAEEYVDLVLAISKSGKRTALDVGFAASDPSSDIVVLVDSDTVWETGTLRRLCQPFADPRVGGVTPMQRILDRDRTTVRRAADWIEDLRYSLTVPAQSVLGQVGCLAGRTIAYRRSAFVPAVRALIAQRVLGLEMSIGDDRVLTNELLRRGWRTVYQPTACVYTEAPDDLGRFIRQQLRWGRSSQRETFLSLPWLWRRPYALLCFASDILIPLALYGLLCMAVANVITGSGSAPLLVALATAYLGMLLSLGARQIPHLRRHPSDLALLPFFVLALSFAMAPLRLMALATMFHNGWGTRTHGAGVRETAHRRWRQPVANTVSLTLTALLLTAIAPLAAGAGRSVASGREPSTRSHSMDPASDTVAIRHAHETTGASYPRHRSPSGCEVSWRCERRIDAVGVTDVPLRGPGYAGLLGHVVAARS